MLANRIAQAGIRATAAVMLLRDTVSSITLASFLVFVGAQATAACSAKSSDTTPSNVAEPGTDAGDENASDASTGDQKDAGPELSGVCTDTFGDKLTVGFGRIDGVVYAVQKPSDTACTMPNDDHVVVQVLMNGAVYRMVTNVQSDSGDPKVRFAIKEHALPPPAWEEGWHEGVALDYPSTLDAHNADFTPYALEELVEKIAADVKVGDKISVYAESGDGRPESAHNIHRTSGGNHDGALVIDPTGSPHFLLFHFDEQTF